MGKRITNSQYDLGEEEYNFEGITKLMGQMGDVASNADVRKGRAFSENDKANAMLKYWETQSQRKYNEYLYNKYESPSAMVRQYEDAGLNPAMMYGQSASVGGDIDATPIESANFSGSQSASGMEWLGPILDAVLGAAGVANQAKANDINAYNAETQRIVGLADAENKGADTEGKKIANWIADQTKQNKVALSGLDVDAAKANIENIRQHTEESKATVDQIKANIKLINKNIELTDKQIEDLSTIIEVHKLDKEKLEKYKPYWAQMAAAELAYTQATTEEAQAAAAKLYNEASLSSYEILKEDGILNYPTDAEGNIDWEELKAKNPRAYGVMMQIKTDAEKAQSESDIAAARAEVEGNVGWQWAQNIGGLVTDIVGAAGSVMLGTGAIKGAFSALGPKQTTYNYSPKTGQPTSSVTKPYSPKATSTSRDSKTGKFTSHR